MSGTSLIVTALCHVTQVISVDTGTQNSVNPNPIESMRSAIMTAYSTNGQISRANCMVIIYRSQ